MDLYIDLENFKSLISDTNNPNHDIGIKTFRKQLNKFFNFEKKDIASNPFILAWIQKNLMQGIEKSSKVYNVNALSQRPITNKTYQGFHGRKKSSIYLLDDDEIEKLKNSNVVIAGGVGEEIDTILSSLIHDQNSDSHEYHEQIVIGGDKFDSWDKIKPYIKPFSNLLFVDRYMFKGSKIGGNLGLFDSNIGKILSAFYEGHTSKSRLIFVYQINKHQRDVGHRDYDEGPDFKYLRKKIKKTIGSISKHCPVPETVFIGVPKGHIKADHDRNIISNYMRIKTGDCMVFFKSDGELKTDSNDFDIYSLSRMNYSDTAEEFKTRIANIINETTVSYPDICSLNGIPSNEVINF